MTELAARDEAPTVKGVPGDRLWAQARREWIATEREQHLVDAEVRETRGVLLRAARRRGGMEAVAFLDEDFLSVADRPTVYRAILDAALTVGAAERADLQLYDRGAKALVMAVQHGFSREFVAFFATVGADAPTACATALTTREPALIDDVCRSEVLAGRPTLEPMLSVGTRAVYSYPLISGGEVKAVLSFHRRRPARGHERTAFVARCAEQVLTRLL